MTQVISPLIDVNELLKIYQSPEVILIDVSNGKDAKNNYESKHLDTAIFVDLNSQLAEIPQDFALGGRHPLPSLSSFSMLLGTIGITKNSHLILYDDKNAANAAARFWWMMRSIGHEKVQVLNGGYQNAVGAGFPVNNNQETIIPTSEYLITNWKLPLATISDVEKNNINPNFLIIDVRENNRYAGIIEPIDLIAGHIPGAINVPFTENLNDEGLFSSESELYNKYSMIIAGRNPENIIVHCGSGVTACHTILAMDYAGLQIPRLYVGSWSEWSRSKNPKAALS